MLLDPSNERTAAFSLGLNEPNQDSVLALDIGTSRSVIAVADGVGGSPRGDLASQSAVDSVRKCLRDSFYLDLDVLFKRAAEGIAEIDNEPIPLATTLTVVRCDGLRYEIGHVGDTRAYHLRGYGIRDLTVDQNEGQVLIKQGVFTRRSIHKYPRRNVLLSALSREKNYDLQKSDGIARSGDRILVVSDGVYEILRRQEIASMNERASSLPQFIHGLKDALLNKGLRDDASGAGVELV